jgi:hypothetical protein
MANTFELIASSTVGSGGASSIDFTSIPNTYTDLVVKLSTRQNGNADGYQLGIRFNGSTSGYSRRLIYGDGLFANSGSGSSETFARVTFAQSSTFTANTFNNFEIYIPNYASSNNKSFSTDGVNENNTTAVLSAGLYAGLWSNTAAITSLTVSEYSGSGTNFVQYSTAYLYGVKNA